MAYNRTLNSKGQVSVEFLLLLVVFFILITQYVLAMVNTSIFSLDDVSTVAQIKAAEKNLASAINFAGVSKLSSSRRISVYLPPTAVMECHPSLGLNPPKLVVRWAPNLRITECTVDELMEDPGNPDYLHCKEEEVLRTGGADLVCSNNFGVHITDYGNNFYRYPASQNHDGMLVSFNIQYEEVSGDQDLLHVVNSTGGV